LPYSSGNVHSNEDDDDDEEDSENAGQAALRWSAWERRNEEEYYYSSQSTNCFQSALTVSYVLFIYYTTTDFHTLYMNMIFFLIFWTVSWY